jgi:hypothetical protein
MIGLLGLLGLEVLLAGLLRRLMGWLLLGLLILLLIQAMTGSLARVMPRNTLPPIAYATDSNVFMDLWPTCRQHIDNEYLDNRAVTLYVHVAIYSQALGAKDRYSTQEPRLSRLQRPGAKRVPMATPLPPDASAMRSKAFDDVDISVLETARKLNVPLLSTDAPSMRNQINDGPPARRVRYGAVPIVDPCAGMSRPAD